MRLNRVLLSAFGFAFVFATGFSFAGRAVRTLAASLPDDAKAGADQEVLKINAQCNDAELRADVPAMDACETDDFTHTHANGMVEHKAEFLKGVEAARTSSWRWICPKFMFVRMARQPLLTSTCTSGRIIAAISRTSTTWS